MVIIKKKDDTISLCVDYRKLNAMTQVNAYPLPRIDDILDQMGQARYITTLDTAKGYWRVPVAEEDRPKQHSSPQEDCINSKGSCLVSAERLQHFNG